MQKDIVLLMASFCGLAGIKTKDMTARIGEDGNQLILTKEEISDIAKISQNVTITLHMETDSIDIKQHIEIKYDFKPVTNENLSQEENKEHYLYQIVDNQSFYLFEVKDQQLNQYSSVVRQNINEDTLGNRSGIIVDFDSYYDTLNEDKRRIVECQKNVIDTAAINYSVPDGYSILDGIYYISDIEGKSK